MPNFSFNAAPAAGPQLRTYSRERPAFMCVSVAVVWSCCFFLGKHHGKLLIGLCYVNFNFSRRPVHWWRLSGFPKRGGLRLFVYQREKESANSWCSRSREQSGCWGPGFWDQIACGNCTERGKVPEHTVRIVWLDVGWLFKEYEVSRYHPEGYEQETYYLYNFGLLMSGGCVK